MGLTFITALEIALTGPEERLIEALQDNDSGKWSSYLYIMRDGEIHKLLLSYDPQFDTEELAKQAMVDVVKQCKSEFNSGA